MRAASLELKQPISSERARRLLIPVWLLALIALATACHSSKENAKAGGLVIVNATATGIVRRVLFSEGATVSENAVILEIVQQPEAPAAPQAKSDDPQARAQSASVMAQRDIRSVEAEVQRAAVEVQRVQPLVAAGTASQAELDAARAAYQHAQEKLQRAKDAATSAQRNLIVQQSTPQSQTPATPVEKIIAVRAPSPGIVRVISVRAGQQVTAGQVIATISADKH